ncbi:hypothetical protein BDN72DRAFT_60835 [Pluteus cervinus]|uniref:Uncharacterized protein n=1 Tax=Pluteus cervinus TaxID=181527 RepID=A0ACD2ZYI8_9AGAR|nr:hypothetical protein BDN72DRAFT_60835 [Pluteus cervinus]
MINEIRMMKCKNRVREEKGDKAILQMQRQANQWSSHQTMSSSRYQRPRSRSPTRRSHNRRRSLSPPRRRSPSPPRRRRSPSPQRRRRSPSPRRHRRSPSPRRHSSQQKSAMTSGQRDARPRYSGISPSPLSAIETPRTSSLPTPTWTFT